MSQPTISAWDQDDPIVDEKEFTPWANDGWHAWNGQSPEWEVCEFTQSLVEMMRPDLVLETGVGQGYMTRGIVGVLNSCGGHLLAFESDDKWREALWALPFWNAHRFVADISERPTPLIEELAKADLCVFDSDWEYRFNEVRDWDAFAKSGSVALIHDTGAQPNTIHASLRELIVELDITGFFLHNPRGCFMAVQK